MNKLFPGTLEDRATLAMPDSGVILRCHRLATNQPAPSNAPNRSPATASSCVQSWPWTAAGIACQSRNGYASKKWCEAAGNLRSAMQSIGLSESCRERTRQHAGRQAVAKRVAGRRLTLVLCHAASHMPIFIRQSCPRARPSVSSLHAAWVEALI